MHLCRLSLLPALLLLFLSASAALRAQDAPRYVRLYLRDKGTPERTLAPSDPLYPAATAHLTPRALARRAKVLPADALVSTGDLPLYQPYLDSIAATGAVIVRTSRWFNTAMVLADSAQQLRLRALPFLADVQVVRVARHDQQPLSADKKVLIDHVPGVTQPCIDERYGQSGTQNRAIQADALHRIGITGEGVFIGILDAGTQWRMHESLKHLNIVAERDFVYNDSLVDDEPGEVPAHSHGTDVLSILAGAYDGTLVGVAPHATIALARTEDVRSERHIEEDNYVAGLEWLESLGVDITNTSLGYTDFDELEAPHTYDELNGHTAIASRGINEATRLGMVCVVAAGNDATKWFHYIGVPAEADSAIAVAAVDTTGRVTVFSSRWFGGSNRVKPNVAAPGIKVWHADVGTVGQVSQGQGTSYASPMTTGAAALLLSARPSLRPWELRELLQSTASRADNPDTAVGHGMIRLHDAIEKMSRTAPVVGRPRARLDGDHVLLYAWTEYRGQLDAPLALSLRKASGSVAPTLTTSSQPAIGLAVWSIPTAQIDPIIAGSLLDVAILTRGDTLLHTAITVEGGGVAPAPTWDRTVSTLCFQPNLQPNGIATVIPNPFTGHTFIQYQLASAARVTIALYNSIGQEITKVVNDEPLEAGYHTFELNTPGLEAGAFYLLLRAGDVVLSEQMIHLGEP